MSDAPRSEEDAMQEPPPDTLAALLTGALAIRLGEAVSALVGKAYTAQIIRIEPRTHGGAEVIVEFMPRPGETILTIEVGADTVEIPLPPGVIDEPIFERRPQEL
jgi:hypothetical protein